MLQPSGDVYRICFLRFRSPITWPMQPVPFTSKSDVRLVAVDVSSIKGAPAPNNFFWSQLCNIVDAFLLCPNAEQIYVCMDSNQWSARLSDKR